MNPLQSRGLVPPPFLHILHFLWQDLPGDSVTGDETQGRRRLTTNRLDGGHAQTRTGDLLRVKQAL